MIPADILVVEEMCCSDSCIFSIVARINAQILPWLTILEIAIYLYAFP